MKPNPIVIIGGWLSAPGDYLSMARTLARPPYNRTVYVADIGRRLWASMRDPDFRPILAIVSRTVDAVLTETGAERIDLIGHSAGGRIARTYLGDVPYYDLVYGGHHHVDRLITLGTAHSTVEIYVAKFGAWVNKHYPGAYYPGLSYRAVAGESVVGRRIGTPEEIFAYRSYEITCGRGDVIGDGVTPTTSCFLSGADNLVLRGVRHAPYNAPRQWYGAREIVPVWFDN